MLSQKLAEYIDHTNHDDDSLPLAGVERISTIHMDWIKALTRAEVALEIVGEVQQLEAYQKCVRSIVKEFGSADMLQPAKAFDALMKRLTSLG